MKAVALTHYLPVDNPKAFLDVEFPKPAASGRDLLVVVKAVSINPVDTKVRAPKDKVEDPPRVLGWDASGVVEAVGPNVTLFKPGDEVYYAGDITRSGSNAQFQHVDHVAIFNDMRHWETVVALIRPQGAIVTIDDTHQPMPMAGMKTKSASLHWEFMFARAMHQTPDMIDPWMVRPKSGPGIWTKKCDGAAKAPIRKDRSASAAHAGGGISTCSET